MRLDRRVPPPVDSPLTWLRRQCSAYTFDALGVYQESSPTVTWPLQAAGPAELTTALAEAGLLLPLPREPAALANVIEVSLTDFLVAKASLESDEVLITRGTERGYPDLELAGPRWNNGIFAVDVKVAKRAETRERNRTQSRITLYTGNTYFKWHDLHWPGTFRPFSDYTGHYDVIVIYTFDASVRHRVTDVELIVQEPWRIASRKRSSTTREYIGAVDLIADIRAGKGEFESADEFYKYWRKFPFKTSPAVAKQLERLLLKERGSSS